jgi:hypothetical protein
MNQTTDPKTLSTADLAAAADRRDSPREVREARQAREATGELRGDAVAPAQGGPVAGDAQPPEQLAPLFLPQVAEQFRSRWDEVQIGFVDDPTQAVRHADELVAQVMKNLAETFAHERANLEGELDESDTEHLRVALRRYRSFFQRLLSL